MTTGMWEPATEEFLRSAQRESTRCLVLDLRLTGMSGLDLLRYLARRSERLDSEAHGPQEIPEGPAQRFVIVYNGNRRPVALVHTSSLSLSERLSRIHLLPG